MSAGHRSAGSAERLDDLRRRLYRADATEADVRRYLAEQDAQRHEEPADVPADRGRAPRRRAVAALALAAATALVLVLAVRLAAPEPEARESAERSSPAAVLLQDVGEGQVLAVAAGAASRPVAVPTAVRGAPVLGQRFAGRGNAVVDVAPPVGRDEGGRTMVVVTTDSPSPVAWRALLVVHGDDRTSYPVIMARGRAGSPLGPGSPTTFVYPSTPPARIAVEAPADARWTLLVAIDRGLDGVER